MEKRGPEQGNRAALFSADTQQGLSCPCAWHTESKRGAWGLGLMALGSSCALSAWGLSAAHRHSWARLEPGLWSASLCRMETCGCKAS